jgi:hypothetical protein
VSYLAWAHPRRSYPGYAIQVPGLGHAMFRPDRYVGAYER